MAATLALWRLEVAGLLQGATMPAVPVLAAAILLGAGLYQLTPLKRACLRGCRESGSEA